MGSLTDPSIDVFFPNAKKLGYVPTSRKSDVYNCIAWAVGRSNINWWPLPQKHRGYYWPPTIRCDASVAAFIAMFSTECGYEEWADENASLENGWEKVAIYASDGEATHAARQLWNGSWTSKIGENKDIEHATLSVLESSDTSKSAYGRCVKIMRRRRRPSPTPLM